MKNKKNEEKKEIPLLTPEEMTDKQMLELLIKLSQTVYWPAILKFNGLKDLDVVSTLISADPFTAPTTVTRAQGIRTGLYFLQQEVEREVERRRKLDEGEEEK